MKKAAVADATLRVCESTGCTLGFKEKIEIVKQLDRLCVDVIETAPLLNGKSDVLFLHTISSLLSNKVLSCAVPLDESLLNDTISAVKSAARPRLNILAPVSTVQMEYHCHQKPAVVLEKISSLVCKAKAAGIEVEVSLVDATRAEKDFLVSAVKQALSNGADIITLCDSAGLMLPEELNTFISELNNSVPELSGITLSVECSDELHMAPACAVACLRAGAEQIKTTIGISGKLQLGAFADILRIKVAALDISTSLNRTACGKIVNQIEALVKGKNIPQKQGKECHGGNHGDWNLTNSDGMPEVAEAV